jgi:hypothetical protein
VISGFPKQQRNASIFSILHNDRLSSAEKLRLPAVSGHGPAGRERATDNFFGFAPVIRIH